MSNKNVEMSSVSDALKAQGLSLIEVNISGSDFKKSLKYSEIGLEKDLETELATLGRKSVFEKTYPKLLRNNKEQVYTYLDKMGVRFGSFGTWAVPSTIYQEVHTHLIEKMEEREAIKNELLSKYDDLLLEFSRQAEELREGFGQVVLSNAYDKAHIRAQIGMVINAQDEIIGGISLSAVEGMSRMARDYERELMKSEGRPKITRFTRAKLEDMRDYCIRFMFLTSVLNDAAKLIDQTISILPAAIARSESYDEPTSVVLTTLKLLARPDELAGIVIDIPDNDTLGLEETEENEAFEESVGSQESDLASDETFNVDDESMVFEDVEFETETEDESEPTSLSSLLEIGDDFFDDEDEDQDANGSETVDFSEGEFFTE